MSELVERLGLSDDEKRMKTEEYREVSGGGPSRGSGKGDGSDGSSGGQSGTGGGLSSPAPGHRGAIPSKYVLCPGVGVSEGIACNYFYRNKILTSTHDFEQDIVSAAWSISRRYESYQPHLKALDKISLMIFDTMKKISRYG
mgnify:CR=1 FL=1